MDNWASPTTRTAASLGLLTLLLVWETVAPFFVFFVGRSRDRAQHAVRNLALGVFNAAVTALVFVALWWAAAEWAEARRFGVLNWLQLPPWAHALGALLLFDAWMYLWHRLNHRIPFLWRFHRTHHSDPLMDVTTANRFHLGEIAISGVLRAPVIVLLGVQLGELALYELLMFAVVQVHHANIALPARLDRALRALIVTPYMHKVHHSRWQPETDSNYSSLFSFWDRLFRSFRLRDDPHTLSLGLDGSDEPRHQTLAGLLTTPWRKTVEPRSPSPPTAPAK